MTKVGSVKCTEFGHYSGSSVMTKAYQHILTRFSHYGDYVLSSRVCVVWIGLSFVTTRFPQGLGTDLKTLKNLCRDHPKALDAIDRACKQPVGVNQHTDNVSTLDPVSKRAGNSRDYGLRRLRKDRPDLHEQRRLFRRIELNYSSIRNQIRGIHAEGSIDSTDHEANRTSDPDR